MGRRAKDSGDISRQSWPLSARVGQGTIVLTVRANLVCSQIAYFVPGFGSVTIDASLTSYSNRCGEQQQGASHLDSPTVAAIEEASIGIHLLAALNPGEYGHTQTVVGIYGH